MTLYFSYESIANEIYNQNSIFFVNFHGNHEYSLNVIEINSI